MSSVSTGVLLHFPSSEVILGVWTLLHLDKRFKNLIPLLNSFFQRGYASVMFLTMRNQYFKTRLKLFRVKVCQRAIPCVSVRRLTVLSYSVFVSLAENSWTILPTINSNMPKVCRVPNLFITFNNHVPVQVSFTRMCYMRVLGSWGFYVTDITKLFSVNRDQIDRRLFRTSFRTSHIICKSMLAEEKETPAVLRSRTEE